MDQDLEFLNHREQSDSGSISVFRVKSQTQKINQIHKWKLLFIKTSQRIKGLHFLYRIKIPFFSLYIHLIKKLINPYMVSINWIKKGYLDASWASTWLLKVLDDVFFLTNPAFCREERIARRGGGGRRRRTGEKRYRNLATIISRRSSSSSSKSLHRSR